MSLVTPEQLRKYLEANKDKTFTVCDSEWCPIAWFLRDTYREEKVSADFVKLNVFGQQMEEETPDWAVEFMNIVDAHIDEDEDDAEHINGTEALECLDMAEKNIAEDLEDWDPMVGEQDEE